jgi:hypothetical protein
MTWMMSRIVRNIVSPRPRENRNRKYREDIISQSNQDFKMF